MTGGGQQKILEFAQHVRPDGVALIARQHGAHAVLALEDVEVVEPEVGQDLFQLAVGIERAVQFGFAQIADHQLLRRARHYAHAAQFGLAGKRVGGQRAGKPLELVGIKCGEECGSLGRRSAQRDLDLRRGQQFIERRPHAPHFHLPLFLHFLASGGLFFLEIRQTLQYVWGHSGEHLCALFRVERHDGRAPLLRGAVEDFSELFARQQFVQTDRLDEAGRKLGKILREDFGSLHADGVERFQTGFEGRVLCDSFGMQLEFDPLFDAQLANRFEVTGARAEGQTVEHMQDLLFVGEFVPGWRSAVCGKHDGGCRQKHAYLHTAIPPRSV